MRPRRIGFERCQMPGQLPPPTRLVSTRRDFLKRKTLLIVSMWSCTFRHGDHLQTEGGIERRQSFDGQGAVNGARRPQRGSSASQCARRYIEMRKRHMIEASALRFECSLQPVHGELQISVLIAKCQLRAGDDDLGT